MITQIEIQTCRKCGSPQIVRNGHNRCGQAQYHCRDCGAYGVLFPQGGYSEERKAEVLRAYQERSSLRGLARTFGISRQTITQWLKKKLLTLPEVSQTLTAATPTDVLEVDELWSFVGQKSNQVWLWTVMCRRTRQIVAFATGDRSQETCRKLWAAIPESYKSCRSFSDFWQAYAAIFPAQTHQLVGKETGQTAHMERWNNTLRQRLARLVRKTLSFSKSLWWHDKVIHWFILSYNASLIT